MTDYISREAAINACYDGFANCRDDCADNIRKIPAAHVRENKKRYWYEDEAGCAICSECRKYAFETSTHHISGWFPSFCPNCGADMREET